MNQQRKAYLFALTAILFWSTMGTAFKLTLGYMTAPLLLFYSTLTAFLFLLAALLISGKFRLLKNLSRKDWLNSAFMGFCNPFMYYLVLFRAYTMIQAQEAVALNYIWPVMLVIFSIVFLRQRIGWVSIAAIIISFCGTFVIATHGQVSGFRFTNPTGTFLAIGSSVFWASFFILNMKDRREEYSKMFLNFAFGLTYIFCWNMIFGYLRLPSWQGLAGSLYIGIFEMGLTFVIWLTALKLSSTTAKVSNLVYLSPFISLFLVSVIVGEKILLSTMIGLVIIVGGILLQQYSNLRKFS